MPGLLIIWVSDWSMVILSMHVPWQTNNIATCFAMHALEHAFDQMNMDQSDSRSVGQ